MHFHHVYLDLFCIILTFVLGIWTFYVCVKCKKYMLENVQKGDAQRNKNVLLYSLSVHSQLGGISEMLGSRRFWSVSWFQFMGSTDSIEISWATKESKAADNITTFPTVKRNSWWALKCYLKVPTLSSRTSLDSFKLWLFIYTGIQQCIHMITPPLAHVVTSLKPPPCAAEPILKGSTFSVSLSPLQHSVKLYIQFKRTH